MSDPDANDRRETLLGPAALIAMLGLCLVGYRALFDFDPTAMDRDLRRSDAAFFSPSGNHPFFVYTISAMILFLRRDRILGALGSPSSLVPGFALLGFAVVVSAWSYFVRAPDLLVLSLSLSLLGFAWCLGGGEACRAILLPAIVLLALIPIPAVIVNEIVFDLQIYTSTLSVIILDSIGLDVFQTADQFGLGDRVFQVIESCSGIRSTQTLTLTAVLLQAIFYRSRLQSCLLVGLAPFVGFAINEIRVLTLVANPYSEFASVHAAQGLAMLVVGILVLAGLDSLFSRWISAAPRRPVGTPRPIAAPRLALAVVAAGLIALASAVAPSSNITREVEWNPIDIPLRIGGWRSNALQLDRQYMGTTRFTKDATRRFTRGKEVVEVFAGIVERGRRSASPLSPKLLALGAGRVPLSTETISLGPEMPEAIATTLRTEAGVSRVLLWRELVDSPGREAIREMLALDRGPGRRPGSPYVIRLSTPITHAQDVETADAILSAFRQDLMVEIAELKLRARDLRRRMAEQSAKSGT